MHAGAVGSVLWVFAGCKLGSLLYFEGADSGYRAGEEMIQCRAKRV